MRICLISEGCYPYVVGGVSSWMQGLMMQMPEHEFIIVSINPYEKNRGKYKYEIPENVVEIREYFLDTFHNAEGRFKRKYSIGAGDLEQFSNLLSGHETDWGKIFSFFYKNRNRKAKDFLMSELFYEVIKQTYMLKFSHTALSDYFWTIRSMLLPLVSILSMEMPEADIYHSVSTGYAGILSAMAKYRTGKPMILTEHGIYTREREEEIIGADWVSLHFKDAWITFFRSLSKCAYEYSDVAIALFENASSIQAELKCPRYKQRVIANGVSVDTFLALERKKLGIPRINIGAVVRLVPIKDIMTMLQSFRLVSQQLPEARFYIMGPTEENPEYYEECRQVCRLMELDHVVEFTGRVDVREYFPMMDVLVLSSISEGQPLSILEGMASGIPYVSTNVGSCKEILHGRENDRLGPAGIIVPIMGFKEMANAIIRIVTNENIHQSMRSVGEERVKKLYTRRMLIDNYKNLYQELA